MAADHCDENLLLAMIALQLDFVDRGQLLAAFHAWTAADESFEEVFLRCGQLTRTQYDVLQEVVREHLNAHEQHITRSLEAISVPPPILSELRRLDAPEILSTLNRIDSTAAFDRGNEGPPPVALETTGSERYHQLRPHAKGGLGQVCLALDEQLHRHVALKELQPQHVEDRETCLRFLREAEITGRLDHPGVVPVYSLGVFDDGRPYYAMRFIHGQSLREAVRRIHRSDGANQSGDADRRLAIRRLLNRFVSVCETIHFAHRKGIVHRDIKPANVMLGDYGETLVVDWGLAKQVDEQATPESEQGSGFNTSSETALGSVVGTPPYMSPEQARGDVQQVGTASDLYSLGATLFTLLTGRPPIPGDDVTEVLARAQRGDIEAPRTINPRVPRPLDSICRRAMALQPGDRYGDAGELAADVERWLADEPVSVHREGLGERLYRWSRRHRIWVLSACLLLVAVTSIATIASYRISRARSEAVFQRDAAYDAKRFLIHVLSGTGSDVATDGHRGLTLGWALDNAIAELKGGLSDRPATDLEVLIAVIKAYVRIGQPHQALDVYDAIGPPLVDQFPLDDPLVINAANIRAAALLMAGRHAEAHELVKNTLPRSRTALGDRHLITIELIDRYGRSQFLHGDLDAAEKLFRESLAGREQIYGENHSSVIGAINNLADLLHNRRRIDEALPLRELAFERASRLAEVEYQDLFITAGNLAMLYADPEVGQPEQGAALIEKVLSEAEGEVPTDHVAFLHVRHALAWCYQQGERAEEAHRVFASILGPTQRTMGELHPDSLRIVFNGAGAAWDSGQFTIGLEQFQLAYDLHRRAFGDEAQPTQHIRRVLAESADQAITVFETRIAADQPPDDTIALGRVLLAVRRQKLGLNDAATFRLAGEVGAQLLITGNAAEAIPYLEEALEGTSGAADPNAERRPAWIVALANACFQDEQYARAATLAREALGSSLDASETDPGALRAILGMSSLRLGDAQSAVEQLRTAREELRKRSGDSWQSLRVTATLGEAVAERGDLQLAREYLVESVIGMQAIWDRSPGTTAEREAMVRAQSLLGKLTADAFARPPETVGGPAEIGVDVPIGIPPAPR